MNKKFFKLFLSTVCIFIMMVGCSPKKLDNTAETESYSEAVGESDYAIHVDYDGVSYEEAKATIEQIRKNDFGDETVNRFTALDHEIYISSDITIYEDGDFMLVFMHPDPGMMQRSGTEVCTSDGGKTWHVRRFNRVSTSSTYIIDKKIIKIDGDGLFDVARVSISYDYGETYQILDTENIFNISAIMLGDMALIDVDSISSSSDEIEFEWRISRPFYRMKVSLSTGEVIEEDIYGLADIAKSYKDTGYIFENSSSEYIDEARLRKLYFNIYTLLYDSKEVCKYIRYAINEIYARKGYDFTGTEYEDYFKKKDWYNPIAGKEISEEEINAYEKANIDLLVKIENEYKMIFDETSN